jgi:hypothetical protein
MFIFLGLAIVYMPTPQMTEHKYSENLLSTVGETCGMQTDPTPQSYA